MSNKPVFYITLFEKQLVRSYLFSDQGSFMKEISEYYRINIITSKNLKKQIDVSLIEFGLNTFALSTTFENYQDNSRTHSPQIHDIFENQFLLN